MTEEQKLDLITDMFMGALIHNKLFARDSYAKLLKRCRMLCKVEREWQKRKEEDRILASMWGSDAN